MKIKYFTDTLYIELCRADVTGTCGLDAAGRDCAITLEQASAHARVPGFSYELVAAP